MVAAQRHAVSPAELGARGRGGQHERLGPGIDRRGRRLDHRTGLGSIALEGAVVADRAGVGRGAVARGCSWSSVLGNGGDRGGNRDVGKVTGAGAGTRPSSTTSIIVTAGAHGPQHAEKSHHEGEDRHGGRQGSHHLPTPPDQPGDVRHGEDPGGQHTGAHEHHE